MIEADAYIKTQLTVLAKVTQPKQRHGRAFTNEEVQVIRGLYKIGYGLSRIARWVESRKDIGCNAGQLHAIVNGRTYREVCE